MPEVERTIAVFCRHGYNGRGITASTSFVFLVVASEGQVTLSFGFASTPSKSKNRK